MTVLRSTLAGRPVDERWHAINLRSRAAAGEIGAAVALGGLLVAEVTGHDPSGFVIVAVAVGLTYIGGVVWYRWRLWFSAAGGSKTERLVRLRSIPGRDTCHC
ncbi:MAG: hypothetical protein ABSE58_01300 [Candidatus Limnocylindrales bacterium]